MQQFETSPFCIKVRVALEHKGIDCMIENVTQEAVRQGVLARLGPPATLPALHSKDEVIQGSGRILKALDRHSKERPLYPADAARRAWVQLLESWADDSLSFILAAIKYAPDNVRGLAFLQQMGKGERRGFLRASRHRLGHQGAGRKTPEDAAEELNAYLDSIATLLAESTWLGGEAFGAADAAVYGQLCSAMHTGTLADLLAHRPGILDWMQAIEEGKTKGAAGKKKQKKQKKA